MVTTRPNLVIAHLIIGVLHLLPATIGFRLGMEIDTHDSVVPEKTLVKVAFQLGTESYTIDANKGNNVLEQLVSMKEESMKLLKEFITKQNVPDDDDVLDEVLSDDEECEDVKSLVKPPKKTKI